MRTLITCFILIGMVQVHGFGQIKSSVFQSLEAGSLTGVSITVNNLVFVPGFFVEGNIGMNFTPALSAAIGAGYQQYRDVRGIPILAHLFVSPNPSKAYRKSYFYTSIGYAFSWDPFIFQANESLRGGLTWQLGWGKRIKTGDKTAISLALGYRTQQVQLVFSEPNEPNIKESLFYHFLNLRLGVSLGSLSQKD